MEQNILQRIREFNRFYTTIIGVTNNHILNSDYSLTEVRTMFEVDNSPGITARQIQRILRLDEGYLSRLISKLSRKKLISKQQLATDKRVFILELTEEGKTILSDLHQRSSGEVAALIEHLNNEEQKELIVHFTRVKELLTKN